MGMCMRHFVSKLQKEMCSQKRNSGKINKRFSQNRKHALMTADPLTSKWTHYSLHICNSTHSPVAAMQ